MLVMSTTGGVLFTDTRRSRVVLCPALSVTVNTTLYVVTTPGGEVKSCVGAGRLLVPLPKFHE